MRPLLGRNVFPIGGSLSHYAEDVTRTSFASVAVFDTEEAAAGKADVILIPRVERSSVYPTNPSRVTMLITWKALDRNGERPLWVATIEGEGMDRETSMTGVARQAFEATFDDLAQGTVDAFEASPELRSVR
jgi:hypothetical protein